MLDQTNVNDLPVSAREILAHEQLTFPHSNVATTGELLNRAQVAHYGKMDLVVKGGHVKLKGSYHKHAQGGTNHKDFTFPDIQRVIKDLVDTFQFDPKEARFNFIEVGVNIEVSTDPTSLIKNFIRYKRGKFGPMQVNGAGYGRQCKTQRFTIKAYNKSLQYGLPIHLLRFEVKVTRMEFLKRYGINHLTMEDLKYPDVYLKLKKMLLEIFNHILLFNPDLDMDSIQNQKDRELVLQGRFPEYWDELPRQRKSEQLKRFTELTGVNNLKRELAELISEKWDKLLIPDKLTTFATEDEKINSDKLTTFPNEQRKAIPDKLTTFANEDDQIISDILTTFPIQQRKVIPDKLTTFSNSRINQPSDKSGQINTTINCYSRTCPITKVDISMQKENSSLLSRTGLIYLLSNDYFKYLEIKLRYLPRSGVSGLHTKNEPDEISHLAKQISNYHNNHKRYQPHVPINQFKLFNS